jgi:hypothetical protein
MLYIDFKNYLHNNNIIFFDFEYRILFNFLIKNKYIYDIYIYNQNNLIYINRLFDSILNNNQDLFYYLIK